MRLSNLYLYPIKSAAGVPLEWWEVDDLGLRFDRRWMVVDPQGEFITQRDLPRMAWIRVRVDEPHLVIEAPGMPPLGLALEPPGGEPIRVTVWADRFEARLPDREADRWLTEFLGMDCRLAYCPSETMRRVDRRYSPADRRVGFADAFPFLVIGSASLDDLNRRLSSPLPMNRFRPNLVVGGSEPFSEDTWRRIRIGAMEFHLVKPCSRCVITTTDQTTAERSPEQEPLRTLATFRLRNGQVMFGQNAIHGGKGRLQVGDMVEVLEERERETGNTGTGKGRRRD